MVWVIDWFTSNYQNQVMTDDQLAVAEQTILRRIKRDSGLQEELGREISEAFKAGDFTGK